MAISPISCARIVPESSLPPDMIPLPWRQTPGGLDFTIRLTPGAASDSIEGVISDATLRQALKVRVRAKAEDNKANRALERLLADWLGIAKSNVAVRAGGKSRLKVVTVSGEPGSIISAATRRLAQFK